MDIRDALAPIRCFLLDMDGTFYLGEKLIDGSLDFLDALDRTGRQCLFLTNNSSKSADFYIEKLRRMGVPEKYRRVLTSGQAAARYAVSRFPGKKAFLLANRIETAELEALGVQTDQTHPDYVLVAFDTELDYQKMTLLCDHVRAGLPYIATHPDYNCPIEGGFHRLCEGQHGPGTRRDHRQALCGDRGGNAAGHRPRERRNGYGGGQAVHRRRHRKAIRHAVYPGPERRNHLGHGGSVSGAARSDLFPSGRSDPVSVREQLWKNA